MKDLIISIVIVTVIFLSISIKGHSSDEYSFAVNKKTNQVRILDGNGPFFVDPMKEAYLTLPACVYQFKKVERNRIMLISTAFRKHGIQAFVDNYGTKKRTKEELEKILTSEALNDNPAPFAVVICKRQTIFYDR